MKRFLRISIILIMCLAVFCACNSASPENKVDTESLDDLPVLYINTVNEDANNMDFVTKPIAAHVSESIASWTPGYVIPPAPYYEDCIVTLEDKGNTLLLDNAQVKVRGNWTTSYDKKPLRIKFENAQSVLGLNDGNKYKNWVLLAEYKDASMLRNKAALTISREILGTDGLYASDAALVEVVINGEYWGVYLLAEQQQIEHSRVDITKAAEGYTGTDIGYFLEFDGYAWTEAPLQSFYISYADNAPLTPFTGKEGRRGFKYNGESGITIKNDIYSEDQKMFISSYVGNVYKIMHRAAYDNEAYVFNETYTAIMKTEDITPREAVERVVNVQSLVDVYILNELFCDADVYFSSFFMSVDFGPGGDKKLTFQAPWDFDSGLGNKNRCIDGTGFYAANGVPNVNEQPDENVAFQNINPWLAVLIHEDWMQEAIRETWTKVYDDGVFERAFTMIEEDKLAYQDAFLRNYDKWDNIINNGAIVSELSEPAAACKTQAEAADFLLVWLQSRVEFLNGQWHK